jgi:hypothetical protein
MRLEFLRIIDSLRGSKRPHYPRLLLLAFIGVWEYDQGMTDLRKIAEKLGKRPSAFATPGEQEERYIDIEQILFRYPTVAMLCVMAICSVVAVLVVSTLLAFLIALLGP